MCRPWWAGPACARPVFHRFGDRFGQVAGRYPETVPGQPPVTAASDAGTVHAPRPFLRRWQPNPVKPSQTSRGPRRRSIRSGVSPGSGVTLSIRIRSWRQGHRAERGNRVEIGLLGRCACARHRAQSRSRSLMEVFDRVFASTRFTMTAQYRPGPGVPSAMGLPGMVPGTTTL